MNPEENLYQSPEEQKYWEDQEKAYEENYKDVDNNTEIPDWKARLDDIYEYLKEYGSKSQLEAFIKENNYQVPEQTQKQIKEITQIKQNATIVQSNELVNATYNFTDVELRLVCTLISLLNSEDKEFCDIKVSIKDLAQKCKLDPNGAYRQIKQACDSIMTKPVFFRHIDRNGKEIVIRRSWFIRLDTFQGEGTLIFHFHDDLKEELIQFGKIGKGGYVSAKGNVVGELGTVFPIRFYFLLLQAKNFHYRLFSLEEIIKIFGLEGKYIDKRTGNLNTSLFFKRVLDVAKNKINEVTDYTVDYKPVKVGRRIEGVKFFIHEKKNENEAENNNAEMPLKEEDTSWSSRKEVKEACEKLLKEGFSRSYLSAIIAKFDNTDDCVNAINTAIERLHQAQKENAKQFKKIYSPGAYLYKTIMDYDIKTERMFAEEENKQKQIQLNKQKELNTKLDSAETWEQILELVRKQPSKNAAIKFIENAAMQKKQLLEDYIEQKKPEGYGSMEPIKNYLDYYKACLIVNWDEMTPF